MLAFLAGADILLQPADPAVVIDAMSAALAQGRFTQARLDRSVRRVLQMKAKAGLFRQRTVPLDKVMDDRRQRGLPRHGARHRRRVPSC